MDTEDSCLYTRIKDTHTSAIYTVQLAKRRVTELLGVTVISVEALITAVTQQTNSAVTKADSAFSQLYSCSDMRNSGAARNSTMEFAQSVMVLTTTRIIGNPRRSRIRADADGSTGER